MRKRLPTFIEKLGAKVEEKESVVEFNIPEKWPELVIKPPSCTCEDCDCDSSPRVYVKDSEDVIRRNWKLVLLDVNNLAGHQVLKIDEKLQNNDLKYDQVAAHKMLKNACIENIDLIRANFILKRLRGN